MFIACWQKVVFFNKYKFYKTTLTCFVKQIQQIKTHSGFMIHICKRQMYDLSLWWVSRLGLLLQNKMKCDTRVYKEFIKSWIKFLGIKYKHIL